MSTKYQLSEEEKLRAMEYVAGSLEEAEKKDFELLLTQNKPLNKLVHNWQNQFLGLTNHLELTPPPKSLLTRIQRSLDDIQETNTVLKEAGLSFGFWNNLPIWRSMAFAGLFSVLILGTIVNDISQQVPTTKYIAVLMAPDNPNPGWVIQTNLDSQIELIPLGTVEIPEGKALELWTKSDDWDKPVSLGLIKNGKSLHVNLENVPLTDNQLFELTIENETGSPTGLPTGPIQSIGRGKITDYKI